MMKTRQRLRNTARNADYGEMQKIVADAVPVIPLIYAPYTFVATDKITGAAQTPLGIYNFKNLDKAE